MWIRNVNKATVNLFCKYSYCKCTLKMALDPKFIKCEPNFYKMSNGRYRSKYSIDCSDPKLRKLTNWKVCSNNSRFRHSVACEVDFFKNHRVNFREDMTVNSFKAKSAQYNMTKNQWNLEGSNIDSVLKIYKECEERSFRKQINYARPTDTISKAPPDSRTIKLYDLATYDLITHNFSQYEDENSTIFLLDFELGMLQNQEWFCDGTFKICKDLDENQCYIISILRENEDKTRCFAYPIVFALCRGKSEKVYTKIFEILQNSFFRNNEDTLIPKAVHSDCKTIFK